MSQVGVLLDAREIGLVLDVTRASIDRWKTQPGHYSNSWRSHLVGRLGEAACERFFVDRDVPVTPYWRMGAEHESKCDLLAGHARIDVKTWSAAFWDRFGRCVAVDQLSKLERKAGSVVWAIAAEDTLGSENEWREKLYVRVILAGCSTCRDIARAPIRLTGAPGWRAVENYQLEVMGLRPMAALLARTRGETLEP